MGSTGSRSRSGEPIWGTDGVPSLPQAHGAEKAVQIDMQGFIFTPTGLRVDVSEVDREELLRSGYGPQGVSGDEFGG